MRPARFWAFYRCGIKTDRFIFWRWKGAQRVSSPQLASDQMSLVAQTLPPPRAWYKPYYSTLLAVGIVAGSLGYIQSRRELMYSGGGRHNHTAYRLGWPLESCCIIVTDEYRLVSTSQFTRVIISTESTWKPKGRIINGIIALWLTLSTAIMCERWRRHLRHSLQFSLRALMGAVTVSSLLLLFYLNESRIYLWCIGPMALFFSPTLRYSPWYLSVPILFGLACTLYALGALVQAGWSRAAC
jgi:hypothetical protein